ncbi:MAG: ROK family protein [Candidatus Dormibacteraeota bacterium]|nr:ROK family protein [Candidatus Dormibacteraeota bacterium]
MAYLHLPHRPQSRLTSEVLRLLRAAGPMSRAEIARRISISKPTASALVETLIRNGLILESQSAPAGNGRPPFLLHYRPDAWHLAAVDIGASNVRVAVADALGELQTVVRDSVVASRSAGDLVGQVEAMLADAVGQSNIAFDSLLTVSVGVPGVVTPESGHITHSPNFPELENVDLASALANSLGLEVLLENDVNLAAIGERWRGAGQGIDNFVFLAIGTGLGAGMILAGELYSGRAGRAGEVGYLPAPTGALEATVSGAALAAAYSERTGTKVADAQTVFEAMQKGNQDATACVEDLLVDLAWVCAVLSSSLDPDKIVLGGGVGVHLAGLTERIAIEAKRYSPIVAPIEVSALDEDAPLLGAVAVGLRRARELEIRNTA